MIQSMSPYIMFDGNGKEALYFYEQVFDATVLEVQTFGEMPSHPGDSIPEEAKDRILHAKLKLGQMTLMLSDTFPGSHEYKKGNHISIAVMVRSEEQSKEIFEKLQEGGEVTMPLQKTFWSASYGKVVDQYGVEWQITTE